LVAFLLLTDKKFRGKLLLSRPPPLKGGGGRILPF